MAMGRNQVRAISGDEQDVIEGRRHYCYLQRAGAAAEIKRRMRRRERRAGKAEARNA
jgi:hypothetical protein